MSKLQPVRGTHDLLPEEFEKFWQVQSLAREIAGLYGFRETQTPIFEFTEVFARGMGETSDVVSKEMYTFEDRGGEKITLRPEFTAGLVRSFISNGLQQHLPLKLFSTGPVFRYERPQKGRQRQFHQVNFEQFGGRSSLIDFEMIEMADRFLKMLGIKAELQINSLGDMNSRLKYRDALVEYLKKFEGDLSADSKTRLVKNPMRILDSKDEGDHKILENAPQMNNYLTTDSLTYYIQIKDKLAKHNVAFTENQKLVRGLDYYTDIVFEFVSGDLGAQNTILAGGRYDGLVKQMGGADTPAVGWAAGMERLILAAKLEPTEEEKYVVIGNSEEYQNDLLDIAKTLRDAGKRVVIAHQFNIGKALKFANKENATHVVILGEEEKAKGVVQLKNFVSGGQKEIKVEELGKNL